MKWKPVKFPFTDFTVVKIIIEDSSLFWIIELLLHQGFSLQTGWLPWHCLNRNAKKGERLKLGCKQMGFRHKILSNALLHFSTTLCQHKEL